MINENLIRNRNYIERSDAKSLSSTLPVKTLFKKGEKVDLGNHRPVRLTSVPGQIKEKIILGVIGKHLKDNEVTGHRQHGLMTEKFHLTRLISFYDKLTHLVDQGNLM